MIFLTIFFRRLLAISACCSLGVPALAQTGKPPYQMKPNTKEIEADFMYSYYQQDGDNSPVTGGIGTEYLTDHAATFTINVPLDSVQTINLHGGADFYSSASTDNIDLNVSSASSSDNREYATLSYQWKALKHGTTYGIKAGFSTEFDYTSISGGLSFSKESRNQNRELNLAVQAYFDTWELISPVELRGHGLTYPTSNRQSFNFSAVYSQVLNKRLQMALIGEMTYMTGLLSTPFHRVYFAETGSVAEDVERLPQQRLKMPVSVRLNYFPSGKLLSGRVVIRTFYRFYNDDFGISAHTATVEVPVKVTTAFTVYPYFRFNTQTASKYFAPYKQHFDTEEFYTSDYDLSGLSSMKYGLGLKYAPLYGLARSKLGFSKTKQFEVKYVTLRGAYYSRSNGLTAYIGSLGLFVGIK